MKKNLMVESLYGFGDNIFLRPILMAQRDEWNVYVQTPYPELFIGTGIQPVKPQTFLYDFANRAMDEAKGYVEKPEIFKFMRPNYSMEDLKNCKTISHSFSKGFKNKEFTQRLSPSDYQISLGKKLIGDLGKVMLVKIPSYRHDWESESRAPKTEYMIECMEIAKEHGLKIISLQDYTLGDKLCEPELEKQWMSLCDKTLHGKLSVDELIGLFSQADCVLTYPNFLLPLSIYLDKPVFCIYGGSISPQTIIDPRIQAAHYSYAAPKPFCNCIQPSHNCNKDISNYVVRGKFIDFLNSRYSPPDKFIWDEEVGYGYYPVENNGVYNDSYFDKYVGYEDSEIGRRLNDERVKLAKKYCDGNIIDFGIGSGQFVRASGAMGYDVCQKAIDWLKANDRWVDFKRVGAYNADLVTFFDSFEHVDDIDELVNSCLGKDIIISIPIFRNKEHVLRSKHFRKDEHYHYFTDKGLKRWFGFRNYECVYQSDIETQIGREGIGTYVFSKRVLL